MLFAFDAEEVEGLLFAGFVVVAGVVFVPGCVVAGCVVAGFVLFDGVAMLDGVVAVPFVPVLPDVDGVTGCVGVVGAVASVGDGKGLDVMPAIYSVKPVSEPSWVYL